MPEVLIATLGTEAQVVTLSLLELKRLGCEISHILIINTSSQDEKILESLARLDEAFNADQCLQHYHYQRELLQGRRGPIPDITTEAEAEDSFDAIFQVVRRYKIDGYRIHLNIAGGRKPMSIYGMVTAQMLFDEHDRLWHLVSNEALVKSRRLFPEAGDEYRLVPVPVIRATDRPDLLRQYQNAQEAVREQARLRREMELELFLARLTKTERRVAHLLGQGLSNEEIGRHLNQKPNTLSKHLTVIYAEWRAQFNFPLEANVRGLLVAELASFFYGRK